MEVRPLANLDLNTDHDFTFGGVIQRLNHAKVGSPHGDVKTGGGIELSLGVNARYKLTDIMGMECPSIHTTVSNGNHFDCIVAEKMEITDRLRLDVPLDHGQVGSFRIVNSFGIHVRVEHKETVPDGYKKTYAGGEPHFQNWR